MIDRHELAVAAVNDATRAYYGDRLCALAVFGSVARGTATSDSDIDLFVVVDRLPDGRVARVREFDAVEREVAARMPDAPVLSPVFKTPDELRAGTPLLLDMVEDARVLFESRQHAGRRTGPPGDPSPRTGRPAYLARRMVVLGPEAGLQARGGVLAVTNTTLAQSYLAKATSRLKVLDVLFADANYSDVVREAQELVELCLKAMLRHVGVEPPRIHDVGGLLRTHQSRFGPDVADRVNELAAVSAWLRKEREFSFYGDIDFVPSEQYSRADAERALADARLVVDVARSAVGV